MGRAITLFLVLMSLGLLLATYNLMMTIVHYTIYGYGEGTISYLSSHSQSDPVLQMTEKLRSLKMENSQFHIALTAESTTYSKWQSRIMYYWYKKQKDLPGSQMGKFTRILHSGAPDNLMDEIPTVVVDPLPYGMDMVSRTTWSYFCQSVSPENPCFNLISELCCPKQTVGIRAVARDSYNRRRVRFHLFIWNRLTGFIHGGYILNPSFCAICRYILMAEPDHIFVRPLPNLVFGDNPAAFSFFYIEPSKHERIIRKFFPEENGPITKIDPIGNSPVIIKKVSKNHHS